MMRIWIHNRHFRNASLCLVTLLAVNIFSGCSGSEEGGATDGMSEGVIVYDVDYPELDPDGTLVTMLPSSFTIKFKDNKIKTIFKTAAGIVEMNIIADANTYEMANVVKIFGDRYVLKMDSSSHYRVGSSLGGFSATKSSKTEQIGGTSAYGIDLAYPDGSKNVTVFATEQLGINDPNWCTVYQSIEHMLMDYSIEQYDIVMHLRASEIKQKQVDDSEFVLDEDCKFLDESEFDEVIGSNLKALMSDM